MESQVIDTAAAVTAAAAAEAGQAIVKEFAFVEGLINTGITYVQNYAWQIAAAVIILAVGVVLGKWTQKLIVRAGSRNEKMDPTLLNFLAGVGKITVLAFTVMMTLSKLGITIAPLIAALSAGIFGATFAIQAPVANYAAGLSIILSRPFRIGDFVTIKGVTGRVEQITLSMTFLRDSEGELVQIPNKRIIGEIIENSQSKRLISGSIGISCAADPVQAVSLIESAVTALDSVEKSPPVRVGINSFGESAIEIAFRCMVPADEYLEMKYRINAEVYRVLKENSIEIPYPQRVVTVLHGDSAVKTL